MNPLKQRRSSPEPETKAPENEQAQLELHLHHVSRTILARAEPLVVQAYELMRSGRLQEVGLRFEPATRPADLGVRFTLWDGHHALNLSVTSPALASLEAELNLLVQDTQVPLNLITLCEQLGAGNVRFDPPELPLSAAPLRELPALERRLKTQVPSREIDVHFPPLHPRPSRGLRRHVHPKVASAVTRAACVLVGAAGWLWLMGQPALIHTIDSLKLLMLLDEKIGLSVLWACFVYPLFFALDAWQERQFGSWRGSTARFERREVPQMLGQPAFTGTWSSRTGQADAEQVAQITHAESQLNAPTQPLETQAISAPVRSKQLRLQAGLAPTHQTSALDISTVGPA